jgi:hypothetical protein
MIRITRNKRDVLDGHRRFFVKALEGVDSAPEIRTISAYHHFRLAHILLYDMGDPRAALTELLTSILLDPKWSSLKLLPPTLRHLIVRAAPSLGRKEYSKDDRSGPIH